MSNDGRFKPGVRNSPETEFKPGHDTFRHPKGTRCSPETEFKVGQSPVNFLGIGVPRYTSRGELNVTTEEVVVKETRGRKYLTKKRTSYARWLWEQHHGPIPQGMVIYNRAQFEIPTLEDLECITRAELASRNISK